MRTPSSLVRPSRVAAFVVALVIGQLGMAAAQTPFIPYFFKNNPHYDKFEWPVYTTEHFEIYYYPQIDRHLKRVASYPESTYEKVTGNLRHTRPPRMSSLLFKPHTQFE